MSALRVTLVLPLFLLIVSLPVQVGASDVALHGSSNLAFASWALDKDHFVVDAFVVKLETGLLPQDRIFFHNTAGFRVSMSGASFALTFYFPEKVLESSAIVESRGSNFITARLTLRGEELFSGSVMTLSLDVSWIISAPPTPEHVKGDFPEGFFVFSSAVFDAVATGSLSGDMSRDLGSASFVRVAVGSTTLVYLP